MRRWLRCLVCLLVICALLINLSPLRVKATGVTAGGVVVGVGITIAVAAALNALGVRQGSDLSSFAEIVNSCADALSPRFAVDGLVTFLSLTQNGLGKTYASANFLQAILDWLFANNIIAEIASSGFSTKGYAIYSGSTYGFQNASAPMRVVCSLSGDSSYPTMEWYVITQSVGATFQMYNNAAAGTFSCDSVCGSGHYYKLASRSASYSMSSLVDSHPDVYYISYSSSEAGRVDDCPFWGGISTTQDLTLESVGQDVDTDYKTYVDTGIVDIEWGVHFEENGDGSDDDNGGGMVGVPVRIPDLSTDSFTDQSQEEAQTGNTPQEILDQLLQQLGGGGSGSGTGDGTGSGNTGNTGNTWVPPSSHTQFALADLSKYFPFCIPFDLFDFFTLLDADPVAPVLSWEIQDLSGQTYALSVNLSEWDSVAQLFRRLQLFLFICGLAAASRKYIKW